MLTKICTLLFTLIILQSVHAQHLRQFNLCDSTAYVLNSDTTIVVGKQSIYTQTVAEFQLTYEFDMPSSTYYIRDFDIVNPDFWYVLVGRKTISDTTILYKSTDKGINWSIDTSYYMAIDSSLTDLQIDPLDPNYYQSINQVQKIGTDTILLFLGYYGSGIVYSVNGGNQWSHWFANQPAHYFGLLECDQSYYLYQLEGDGFMGRMFAFDKQFLFRNDAIVNFDHLPSGSGHHTPFHLIDLPNVVYYSNLSYCEVYSFLNSYVDSICQITTATLPVLKDHDINIYPNPSKGQFNIDIHPPIYSQVELIIYNSTGQRLFSQQFRNTEELSNFQSFPNLQTGVYTLVINEQEQFLVRKIVIY